MWFWIVALILILVLLGVVLGSNRRTKRAIEQMHEDERHRSEKHIGEGGGVADGGRPGPSV